MRFNIVKSQLQSFVIRVISTVFRCRRRCRQVIIRARDSFQPGHIPVNRIDAAGSWRAVRRDASIDVLYAYSGWRIAEN